MFEKDNCYEISDKSDELNDGDVDGDINGENDGDGNVGKLLDIDDVVVVVHGSYDDGIYFDDDVIDKSIDVYKLLFFIFFFLFLVLKNDDFGNGLKYANVFAFIILIN